jgi:putative exosortase-associated protein (TIGR04073 family)
MKRWDACQFTGVVVWLSVLPFACCLLPSATMAQDETDRVLLQSNVTPAFEKLGRGFSNTVGGWLEVPYQIEQRYTRGDTSGSLFAGTLIGLAKGVVRTGVGVYEVVTFWLPLPEQFAPILPTLPYFNKAEPRKPLLLE